MKKPALRLLLTLFMYAGILLTLVPFLSAQPVHPAPFLITGAADALLTGLLRHTLTPAI